MNNVFGLELYALANSNAMHEIKLSRFLKPYFYDSSQFFEDGERENNSLNMYALHRDFRLLIPFRVEDKNAKLKILTIRSLKNIGL